MWLSKLVSHGVSDLAFSYGVMADVNLANGLCNVQAKELQIQFYNPVVNQHSVAFPLVYGQKPHPQTQKWGEPRSVSLPIVHPLNIHTAQVCLNKWVCFCWVLLSNPFIFQFLTCSFCNEEPRLQFPSYHCSKRLNLFSNALRRVQFHSQIHILYLQLSLTLCAILYISGERQPSGRLMPF